MESQTTSPSSSDDERTPIWLISGFLGAGKTTLLNHLLRTGWEGEKVAVAVNDFGKVSVDAQLLKPDAQDVLALPNGCVCCVIQGALVAGLERLLHAGFDRVVLETSGISDPAKIRTILESRPLDDLCRLESTIIVAHAVRHTKYRKAVILVDDQIRAADVVVLNQVDQADAQQQQETLEAIHEVNKGVRILHATQGRVNLVDLVPAGGMVSKQAAGSKGKDGILAYEVRFHEQVSEQALRAILEGLSGDLRERLYRLKGFIKEDAGEMLHIEWAGQLAVSKWDADVDAEAVNALMAIGTLSEDELRSIFENLPGIEVVPDVARKTH